MDSENAYCTDYVTSRPEAYTREVPVGNMLLRETDLSAAAAGPFAGAIDALHSPATASHERLVECKVSPTFRALGQLLLYEYFRRRDRDLVRDAYDGTPQWDRALQQIAGFETHVDGEGEGSSTPKPALDQLAPVLATGQVRAADTLLLSGALALGFTIEHRTNGTWQTLDPTVFETTATGSETSVMAWLREHSRDSLDSSAEAQLWDEAADLFEGTHCFKEIPIGTRLYPNRERTVRVDCIARAGDHWFVIEIKRSANEEARPAFQRAFGQATCYANLFAREWGIPTTRVAPVVIQQPLALVGGVYRTDRYDDDYDAMRQAAFRETTQPLIIGPAQQFS